MRKFLLLVGNFLTFWCLCSTIDVQAQLPAFPGAEGAGMYTTGGRGTPSAFTTVFEVTNLSDDGQPGSLRYALTAPATYRTVVFRISGTIHLNSRLSIKANTTIAGQTAPGDGICVADHQVSISGDNVIIRYMRFRVGDRYQKVVDSNGNPVDGSGGADALSGTGPSNIIIDHVTASWSNDEALTVYRGDNLTIQWSIISEPLNYSYHWETGDTDYEQHGYGGIWGAKRGSMHHNLFAHCRNRTPRFAGVSSYTPNTVGVENVDLRNNVLYNWGINNVYGGEGGNYNVVNNYYKYGPNTGSGVRYRICNPSFNTTDGYGKWYVDGNYVDGSPTNTSNNWAGVVAQGGSADVPLAKATSPFDIGYPLTPQSAVDAYEAVLNGAGCSLPNRDTLDERIVNDVRNRTGRIIDVQGGYPHGTPYAQTVNAWPALNSIAPPADSDHDGMSDTWETNNGFNPNDANDRNIIASNGYTNLENYLNSLTNPVVNTNPVIYANAAFSSFAQTLGSPSTAQTFQISGANLTNDIVVTAPANYQLSTNGTNWSSSITLTPNSGNVSATISVRLNASATGTYSGVISAASDGATTINSAVNGSTSNPVPPVINQKQIIGIYPAMEGGFENQPAGTVSSAAPTGALNPSPTVWTTNGNASIMNDGNARTGSNYFTYTSTSTSTKNNYSPAVTTPLFVKGTKYIVQYYYRAPAPSLGNTVSGLLAATDNTGTTNFTTAYSTIAWVGTNGAWQKAALPYSLNNSFAPTTVFAGFRFNGGGTAIAKPFDIDDFVVYPADNQLLPSADILAPDPVLAATTTGNNNTIDISWSAPATGLDGGGYIVLRTSSSAVPALNANGLYSLGNNIGTGNTVVYIGRNTGFTDNGSVAALTQGITYYYHIFTADKAFNYSPAVTTSGATTDTSPVVSVSGNLNPFSQTVGTPSPSQSFTVQGNNLTAITNVTAPAGFELSDDESTWKASLSFQPENKSLNETAFVRLNTSTPGSHSGNITVASAGATNAQLAISGNTSNPVPEGYDVVVAADGSGNYTSLQAAINAAPSNRTTPYRILVKKGKYIEKVTIPSNKPFLHVVGEGINEVVFSWDDYAGKPGVTEIATITINSNDCVFMNMTIENSWGRKNDGPQALAVKVTGDRVIFKSCKMVSGQDTLMAHGNGKRQYYSNCYIDGNTDYIYGSAIAVFDSCVLYNRDRLDGSTSSVFTAASTPAGQTYGYVFRDCLLPNNNGQTTYTLGRPWGNAAPPHTSETKVVFLNCRMGTTVKPERWQVWTSETNTSLITYAEYKTRYFSGALVDLSKRVSWSKEFTDEQAAPYFVNSNIFGTWDPCSVLPETCAPFSAPISLSNFRVNRSSSQSNILFNVCWPINGVTFELHRSTDSVSFSKVKELVTLTDTTAAYMFTDVLPPSGISYFYKIVASKGGYETFTTDTVIKVDRSVPLNGDFRSAGSGFWTNASSGNGSNPASIWEKYVAASNSWVLQPAGVQPSNANVTVRSGHIVKMDGLKSVNNLTIEEGAVLNGNGGYGATPGAQTLRIGVGQAASVTFQNDGIFGGDTNPQDLIILEFNPACASVLWTGSGVSKITRLRPLPANTNALSVVFDQDVSLSYNLSGFTAYYNTATNATAENVTYTINKGKTIKLTNPSASFSPTGSTTTNPGGRYTYNIEGTLDMSVTTSTSNLVPYSNNASSIVSLNIGSEGVLKLGKGFNTVNSSPSTTGNNGKLVMTIADGGLVDATKTTNLNFGNNYFITSGTGALKRSVGSTSVSFPIGTSVTSYNPVTLTNTGTADNFSVSLKNTFDYQVADSSKVVNKQWDIIEDVSGGSNLTAKFGWVVADQASGFDPAQPTAVMQYKESTWSNTPAAIAGNGTVTDPYTVSASGINSLSAFGVTNYTKATATIKLDAYNYSYDGNPHAVSGFAYGTGGEEDKLSPALSFVYKDTVGNILNSAPAKAGTYVVGATYAGNAYYKPASDTALITITPKALTITASNQVKECGTALNLGTTAFTVSGLLAADTVHSVLLTSEGAAESGSKGTYAIVAANAQGSGLSNYLISYLNGSLEVSDVNAPVITSRPEVPALCYSNSGTYTIPALSATDGCGSVNVSYSISGSTNRSGNGANASGSFNIGTSTIHWVVNDGNGNQATTETSVVINNPLSVSIPDVYAVDSNVDAKNTLYLGYGPSSLTINALPSGGTGPYTFLWNNVEGASSLSVNSAGVYTVNVIDALGCSSSASITINVEDVRCGNNNDKVKVCHNGKEICISSGDVQDHLNHGDRLGSCNPELASNSKEVETAKLKEVETANSSWVNVYPNPVELVVQVSVSSLQPGATLHFYNGTGILMRSLPMNKSTESVSMQGFIPGLYLLVIKNGNEVTTKKVLKQ